MQRVTTSRVLRPVERDHHVAFFGSSPLRLLGWRPFPTASLSHTRQRMVSLRHVPGERTLPRPASGPSEIGWLGTLLFEACYSLLQPVTAVTACYSLTQPDTAGGPKGRPHTRADSLLITMADCYTSILLSFAQANVLFLCSDFRCYNRYKVIHPW